MVQIVDRTWIKATTYKKRNAINSYLALLDMIKEWRNKNIYIKRFISEEDIEGQKTNIFHRNCFISNEEEYSVDYLKRQACFPECLGLFKTKNFNGENIEAFFNPEKYYNKAIYLRYFNLRESKGIDDKCVTIMNKYLKNLCFINLSGCHNIESFQIDNWPFIEEIKLNDCQKLNTIYVINSKALKLIEAANNPNLNWILANYEASLYR